MADNRITKPPDSSVSSQAPAPQKEEVCPICGTLDYGCCPSVAIGDPWVCLKHRVRRRDFGEELADMVKARAKWCGECGCTGSHYPHCPTFR